MSKHSHRETQLQHIQGRRAEAFRQLTAGISPDQMLIAPLDIGKNVDWAAFHTGAGLLLLPPLEVSTLKAAYEQYVSIPERLIAQRYPHLVVSRHDLIPSFPPRFSTPFALAMCISTCPSPPHRWPHSRRQG